MVSVSGSYASEWIARLSPDGDPIWMHAVVLPHGPGSSAGPFVKTFPDGSFAIGGAFGNGSVFGGDEPNAVTLQNGSDGIQGFVARYDAGGHFQWVRPFGAPSGSFVTALAAAPDGTAYAVIELTSSDPYVLAPGELDLAMTGQERALVALSRDGHFVHGVRFSTGLGNAPELFVQGDGSVVMTDFIDADTTLAEGTPHPIALALKDGSQIVAHFSPALEIDSAQFLTTSSVGAVLADGSSYFTGSVATTTTVGSGPSAVTLTNPNGSSSAMGYVARFDASGQLRWAQTVSGAGLDVRGPFSVSALSDGSAWVAGAFHSDSSSPGSLVFGRDPANSVTLATKGSQWFIVRMTPEGRPAWAVLVDNGIVRQTAASRDSLVAVGMFMGSGVSVGSHPLAYAADAGAANHAFVARLGP
jgi:hypothetical protein